MSITTWTVQGMTCAHCVAAVTSEVSALPGVSTVDVELATGRLTITASTDPSAEQVAAAVDEAGYVLATG
jgi:copper chaperone CopZ